MLKYFRFCFFFQEGYGDGDDDDNDDDDNDDDDLDDDSWWCQWWRRHDDDNDDDDNDDNDEDDDDDDDDDDAGKYDDNTQSYNCLAERISLCIIINSILYSNNYFEILKLFIGIIMYVGAVHTSSWSMLQNFIHEQFTVKAQQLFWELVGEGEERKVAVIQKFPVTPPLFLRRLPI